MQPNALNVGSSPIFRIGIPKEALHSNISSEGAWALRTEPNNRCVVSSGGISRRLHGKGFAGACASLWIISCMVQIHTCSWMVAEVRRTVGTGNILCQW